MTRTKIRKVPRPAAELAAPVQPPKIQPPEAQLPRVQPGQKPGAKPQTNAPQAQERRAGPRTPHPAPPEDRTLRLFFALKVPQDVAEPLGQAQRNLRGNWRSVRPDQFHITLAYLPAVPPERVDDLKRLGAELTRDLPPMPVRLRGTGYFPNEGSPRVWFVKVEAEGLTELAAQLREGLRALGIPTDDLPFKAHVTLARKKGPAPRLAPLTFDLGWQAGNAALFRSTLRKTGPIYDTVSTFRFRGAAQGELPATGENAAPPATGPFPLSTFPPEETP